MRWLFLSLSITAYVCMGAKSWDTTETCSVCSPSQIYSSVGFSYLDLCTMFRAIHFPDNTVVCTPKL